MTHIPMRGINKSLLCLCLVVVATVTYKPDIENSGKPFRNAGILRLFYELNDVKSVFRMPEYSHVPGCQRVLDVFEHECCPFEKKFITKDVSTSRFPFIVFEGNHRISTSILSKRFSKMITASYFSMAPPCLIPYRKLFTPKDLLLRRAFFSLAVYALGYQAAESLQRWPVVVASYWNHQAIFALTKLLNDSDLPEPRSGFYSLWPEDLVKPDILFYVNFPDDLHFQPVTTRRPNSWKPRLLEFYRRLEQPLTIELNTKDGWDRALQDAKEHVIKYLGSTKTFTLKNITFRTYGNRYNRSVRPVEQSELW
uniref:Fucosyltransferase N-terminal domain-containing protein n=1 Tax=Homalodisca liturata TaxID=320908 RepID=A0A1B6JAF3_9HEMI